MAILMIKVSITKFSQGTGTSMSKWRRTIESPLIAKVQTSVKNPWFKFQGLQLENY